MTRTEARDLRAIRNLCGLAFLVSWLIAAYFLHSLQFHWLNGLYLALLATPILSCIGFRLIHLRREGWHLLSWSRARRLYGWTLVSGFTLLVLIYSVEHWRGRLAYQRLKTTVESAGGTLDPSSLAPPEIPNDQNLCETPLLRALIQGNHNANLVLGDFVELADTVELDTIQAVEAPYRRPLEGPWWFSNRPTDFSYWVRSKKLLMQQEAAAEEREAYARQLLEDFAPFESVLTELAAAAKDRPEARWNLPYERGWMVEALVGARNRALEHLVTILAVRSSAWLALGETHAALADLQLGLRLANSLEGSPIIDTQLKRVRHLLTLVQPLWEGLANHQWDSQQLETLAALFAGLALLDDADRLRRATALTQMDMWDQIDQAYSLKTLRQHYRQIFQRDDGARLWIILLWQLHPKGWNYQSQTYTYRFFFPAKPNEPVPTPVNPICDVFVLPKLKALAMELEEHFPHADIAIQEAALAVELEKYYQFHGRYPASKELLTRDTAEMSVAIDYHRSEEGRYMLAPKSNPSPLKGFVADRNPHLVRIETGYWDLVWRYPAEGLRLDEQD